MRVAKLVGRVPPTKRLKKPHREIAQLLAADEERLAKWQKSSYPSSFDQPFYLSPYEQRRLKLLDAVFKGVSNAGGRQVGRANVCTPVTNAHRVCSLMLENT